MKNNMLKPAVVLTGICLVVALLLAAVNMMTAPVIEKAQRAAAEEACRVVMPDGAGYEEIQIPAGAPATVKNIWRETEGKGWTVKLVTNGFSSGYQIMCGISSDRKITACQVLEHSETEGYGSRTKTDPGFTEKYKGKSASEVEGNPDLLLSGATVSSTAFRKAIADAFAAIELLGEADD